MKEIVFSPTGGTRKVADAICKGFGDDVSVIDLCAPIFDHHHFAVASVKLV